MTIKLLPPNEEPIELRGPIRTDQPQSQEIIPTDVKLPATVTGLLDVGDDNALAQATQLRILKWNGKRILGELDSTQVWYTIKGIRIERWDEWKSTHVEVELYAESR